MSSGAAEAAGAAAGTRGGRPRLFTKGFAALLGVTFLGYGANQLIQPIVPLLIINLGGDAALVGLIVASYSLPSIVFRPFIARWADEHGLHGAWSIGLLLLTVANLLYLVPSLIAMIATRIFHGTAWATFNTGGHATMAMSAPAARRGEASSFYNMAVSIAQLSLPGVALVLWSWFGAPGPLLVAAALSALAFLLTRRGPVPRVAGHGAASADGKRPPLLERGAILSMLIEFLYSTPNTLFVTFLPIFAVERHIPLTQLAVFFPIYGLVFFGTRLGLARFVDRMGRRVVLGVSVTFGIAGMLFGIVAGDLNGVILAGAFYAVGAALETPAAMALAIDRSDPRRIGAAMATYSIGYQMALGVGSATFGLVIGSVSYSAAFAVAAAMLVVLAVLLAVNWRSLPGGQRKVALIGD